MLPEPFPPHTITWCTLISSRKRTLRDLLEAADCFAEVVPIVRGVHQTARGLGNPDGLGGNAIAMGGQVVGLADAYDRLVHGHGSQARLGREEALAGLAATPGRWNADVHDALVRVTTAPSADS